MRGATNSAKKVKQVFNSLRNKLGKVQRPTPGDPVTQIVLGVFSRDVPESRARDALETLRTMVVDYNELRVIPPIELADAVGDYPEARLKCEDVSRALNKIFSIEHSLSLDRVAALPKREMLDYLSKVDGLEAYTRARIRLLGFGQHAIPLDEAMWAFAREHELVDPKCPLDQAQLFLERQVEEEDALDFVALLRKQAWTEFGNAVRKGEVERIRSIPPDRTSRNMLQLVMSGQAAGPAMDDDVEMLDDPELAADGAPEKPAKPKRAVAAKKSESRPRKEKPKREKGKAAKPAAKRSVGAR